MLLALILSEIGSHHASGANNGGTILYYKSYHGGFSLRASYVFVIVSFLGQDFLTVDFALLLFGVVAVK